MAKQLYSSGPNTALIEGAGKLAAASLAPVNTSELQKTIGKSTERIQKYALQRAEARRKTIQEQENRVIAYKEKFPVSQNQYNIPKEYRQAQQEWVMSQKKIFDEAAEKASTFQKGSEEEREQRAIMQNVLYALENNADQWKGFPAAQEDDQQSFENREWSAANNPDDIIFTADLMTNQARYLGGGADGKLRFEKGGQETLWEERPSPRLKSFKAANTLGKEVDRIISKGRVLEGAELKRSMDVLFSAVQDDDSLLSLATDSLFNAYSDEGVEIEPIPGAYEIYQESDGPNKLRQLVVDKYKSLMIDISKQAAADKKKRDLPTGEGGEFIFDPIQEARIADVEVVLTGENAPAQYKGVSLNIVGQTRDYDISIKGGKVIANDPKGGVYTFDSFQQLKDKMAQAQQLQ